MGVRVEIFPSVYDSEIRLRFRELAEAYRALHSDEQRLPLQCLTQKRVQLT